MQVQPSDALPKIMLARYYGASLGRFLSPDKLGGSRLRPKTFNRYTYARNNPVNRFDPDGRKDEYLKFRSTKQAIVDSFKRFDAKQRVETGTAAYDTKSGGTKLVQKTGTSSSVPTGGPSSPEGRAEIDAGGKFRGEAHMHPDGNRNPSITNKGGDLAVWLDNNRAVGIEPSEDPENAIDGYIVTPDGNVYRYNYGIQSEQVTTVDELEEDLDGGDASGESETNGDETEENKSSAPSGQTEGICRGSTVC